MRKRRNGLEQEDMMFRFKNSTDAFASVLYLTI